MLLPSPAAVLLGLVLLSVGTFFAQAVATGFVGRAARATAARQAASISPAISSVVSWAAWSLGQIYDRLGWPACVGGIALALFVAISLTPRLLVQRSVVATPYGRCCNGHSCPAFRRRFAVRHSVSHGVMTSPRRSASGSRARSTESPENHWLMQQPVPSATARQPCDHARSGRSLSGSRCIRNVRCLGAPEIPTRSSTRITLMSRARARSTAGGRADSSAGRWDR